MNKFFIVIVIVTLIAGLSVGSISTSVPAATKESSNNLNYNCGSLTDTSWSKAQSCCWDEISFQGGSASGLDIARLVIMVL